ncbi:MAG TPA: hypothetical protein VFK13_13240 [Gemmatimonadaceae bacterium]|nr:hypothetical protein [Gemmatimonadaceae bacterium]
MPMLPAGAVWLFVAVLWLPGFFMLGGAASAIAWWTGRRGGGRALVGAWLGVTLVTAAAFGMYVLSSDAGASSHATPGTALGTAAVAAVPLAICLGVATLVVRTQLAKSTGTAGRGILTGAAAAAGAWFSCAALVTIAMRVMG